MLIFGVKIDNLSRQDILSKIEDFLCNEKPHLITTPNPEMLVCAEYDWFFQKALNQADLAVADGAGLVWAARYLYGEKLNRWPGADLMEKICEMASREGRSVYLLGGGERVALEAGEALKKKYPGLRIAGAEKGIIFCHPEGAKRPKDPGHKADGVLRFAQNDIIFNSQKISNTQYLIGLNFDQAENQKLLQRIRQAAPDILFVAFGHGKQEKWLAEFLPSLSSVKIAMGVGGAFDFLAGRVGRAPELFRQAGLEWFWRLIHQPWRLKRIWRAIISFAFLVRDYKRQLSLPYRQGVIGFIMNKEEKFFIAKRHASPTDYYFHGIEHWQPPQGAIEPGESPEKAVVREIKEETGLSTEVVFRCQEKCQYDWSIEFMRKRGLGYHFRGQQKQVVLLKYKGDGSDISIDHQELDEYRWVTLEELKQIIHPFRRESLEILIKECKDVIS